MLLSIHSPPARCFSRVGGDEVKETSRGESVVIVAGGVVGFDDSGAGESAA